jgi:hypothetical protein
MRDGDYKRKLDLIKSDSMRSAAAERFPALQKMLGNLPPTPAEIEKIRLEGPWVGFGYPLRDGQNRYVQTVIKAINKRPPTK